MGMLRKFGRLFVIKNRLEACAGIYALALGAIERGLHYMQVYPGFPGWLFMAACTCAVFMAGARLLEFTRRDNRQRRRRSDYLNPVYPGADNRVHADRRARTLSADEHATLL